MHKQDAPIGVFDSGVGGLTVLHALEQVLPHEPYVYLGDTARLPYGTKSKETIIAYTLQATQILIERGIKLLVIACNTASTQALPALRETYPNLPIIGMVVPGSKAALQATQNKKIAVIATEATVHSHAYQTTLTTLDPEIEVYTKACQLLVPLAEEGLVTGAIPRSIIQHYLHSLFVSQHPDTLILGCTHFPILKAEIAAVVGSEIKLIDSGEAASQEVVQALAQHQLQYQGNVPATIEFLVTDNPARFIRFGKTFLGHRLHEAAVHWVDLI